MGYQIHYPGAEHVSQKDIQRKKRRWMLRSWLLGIALGLVLLPQIQTGLGLLASDFCAEARILIPAAEAFSDDLQAGKHLWEAIEDSIQVLSHENTDQP